VNVQKNNLYAASSALVLFIFWLLLSGHFTAFLMTAGAISAIAVVAFARRMNVVDREGHPIDLSWRAATFWPWLWVEIVKSAWDVSKIIVNPRLPISPNVFHTKASQKTTVGLVTFANSITLTPGTISIDVSPGDIEVHALTQEAAAGLASGEMDQRVTKFEGAK